jgi:hypothetical protein
MVRGGGTIAARTPRERLRPMSWLKGPMTPRELALLRETTAPR